MAEAEKDDEKDEKSKKSALAEPVVVKNVTALAAPANATAAAFAAPANATKPALATTAPAIETKKAEAEVFLDDEAVSQYASVIAEAAEDNEPEVHVVYTETMTEDNK